MDYLCFGSAGARQVQSHGIPAIKTTPFSLYANRGPAYLSRIRSPHQCSLLPRFSDIHFKLTYFEPARGSRAKYASSRFLWAAHAVWASSWFSSQICKLVYFEPDLPIRRVYEVRISTRTIYLRQVRIPALRSLLLG